MTTMMTATATVTYQPVFTAISPATPATQITDITTYAITDNAASTAPLVYSLPVSSSGAGP